MSRVPIKISGQGASGRIQSTTAQMAKSIQRRQGARFEPLNDLISKRKTKTAQREKMQVRRQFQAEPKSFAKRRCRSAVERSAVMQIQDRRVGPVRGRPAAESEMNREIKLEKNKKMKERAPAWDQNLESLRATTVT